MKTVILNSDQIARITKRIALQIIETCYSEKSLLIGGIKPRGEWVAKEVITHLSDISDIPYSYFDVDPYDIKIPEINFKDQCVILVDDIVNSGNTMMKSASMISLQDPKRLMTVCLVDRMHRKFPIMVDFTGLSLATTIQEHLSLKTGSKPEIILE
ncbi:MAG: phosphoribosyltransferase family protein [Flavobacteriales bacterium]